MSVVLTSQEVRRSGDLVLRKLTVKNKKVCRSIDQFPIPIINININIILIIKLLL